MIHLRHKSHKINYFIEGLIDDSLSEDSTFMRLYLLKALNTLVSGEEVKDYCTEYFYNILGNYEVDDCRFYPIDTLQKDKFLSMVYYYRGLKSL